MTTIRRFRRRRASPREVVFVKYYQKGSTDIAADQMAVALQRRGIAARSLFAAELGAVHDAVLVFIKRADLADLLRARLRGHALVLDVHDTIVFRRGIRYAALYDGLIFRNRRGCDDFGGGRPGSVVIPHHWDERHRPNRAGLDRLRLAFIGDARSFPYPEPLPGVDLVLDGEWFTRGPLYNAHLSIRRPGRELLYKPNLKVATAAACEAVLLTTRDCSAVEHLGEDYPFYTEPDREAVVAAIAELERRFGGPDWQRALEQLAAVRAATSLERITDLYLEYLARFGELRSADDAAAARSTD